MSGAEDVVGLDDDPRFLDSTREFLLPRVNVSVNDLYNAFVSPKLLASSSALIIDLF